MPQSELSPRDALKGGAASPADFPVGGPLLGPDELARELGCSRRQVEKLFELGEIPSFKFGAKRKTTAAAKDAYIKRLIEAEQKRLEELAE